MPRGDGTGPLGMARMTGRGAGFCAGYPVSDMNPARSFGLGLGRGRGFKRMFCFAGAPLWAGSGYSAHNTPIVDEKEYLNQQAEALENQLQQVRKRLKNFNEETE